MAWRRFLRYRKPQNTTISSFETASRFVYPYWVAVRAGNSLTKTRTVCLCRLISDSTRLRPISTLAHSQITSLESWRSSVQSELVAFIFECLMRKQTFNLCKIWLLRQSENMKKEKFTWVDVMMMMMLLMGTQKGKMRMMSSVVVL